MKTIDRIEEQLVWSEQKLQQFLDGMQIHTPLKNHIQKALLEACRTRTTLFHSVRRAITCDALQEDAIVEELMDNLDLIYVGTPKTQAE